MTQKREGIWILLLNNLVNQRWHFNQIYVNNDKLTLIRDFPQHIQLSQFNFFTKIFLCIS